MQVILALDAGTTNVKAILVDREANVLARSSVPLTIDFPKGGWVEQSAQEVWHAARQALEGCLAQSGGHQLAALGISNQRETLVAWNRGTGEPVGPCIVWQCRRSAEICQALRQKGFEETIRAKTGLQVDPLFPASKIQWLLENRPDVRKLAEAGGLCLGTVDAWLVWNLTGGKRFVTDFSNASRTQLFNLAKGAWDPELLTLFGVPSSALPEVVASNEPLEDATFSAGKVIPICGILGDSHAALLGHGVLERGKVKATYGTGSSLMTLCESPGGGEKGISSTIAWKFDRIQYAYEGNITVTGSGLSWALALTGFKDLEAAVKLATELEDNGGVYFVPALAGLGAPHWDERARGAIVGLSFGARKEHVVRAALEAIAFQVKDVFDAMQQAAGARLEALLADGGASKNDWLMQFQADVIDRPVLRSQTAELSGLGAAFAAGLGCGFWSSTEEVTKVVASHDEFNPGREESDRKRLVRRWNGAVVSVKSYGLMQFD
ncbi:MAG: glycerol kinase GlpK [Verrucomicrobia bacterium]|nr:glycerol kinase GlpK [Verrucomicrobiota bacterium]